MDLTYFAQSAREIFSWPHSTVDAAIKIPTAIFAAALAVTRFKQYLSDRKEYKESEEIVNRALNRPRNRKPFPSPTSGD